MTFDPKLPVELEREIFEPSLPKSHPDPHICRPSRENMVISVAVYLDDIPKQGYRNPFGNRWSRNDKVSKPAVYFHDHVRHLHLLRKPAEAATEILVMCDAVINLAVDRCYFPLSLLAGLPRQRLYLHFAPLSDRPSSPMDLLLLPPFTSITHFNIIDWQWNQWESWWSGLSLMPRLTHLSFYDYMIPERVCLSAFAHYNNLKVLAIVYPSSHGTQLEEVPPALQAQPRFVLVTVDMFVDNWMRGARGGNDHFAVAESHVKRRLAGETDALWATSRTNLQLRRTPTIELQTDILVTSWVHSGTKLASDQMLTTSIFSVARCDSGELVQLVELVPATPAQKHFPDV
ncbi:hypothetical protein B0H11DRAFT_1917629 [Mycena galericulata]|nr:hypothetical protein B0H11DRAFT_1917629 [Mycena galericulata]